MEILAGLIGKITWHCLSDNLGSTLSYLGLKGLKQGEWPPCVALDPMNKK